jgi:hypothetical protein
MTQYEWLKTTFVDPTRFYRPDMSQESWFTDERSAGSILQCNEFNGMSEYLTRPKREQEGECECHYGNDIIDLGLLANSRGLSMIVAQ